MIETVSLLRRAKSFLFGQKTFHMLYVTSVSTTSYFLNAQEKQPKSLHEHSSSAPLDCC